MKKGDGYASAELSPRIHGIKHTEVCLFAAALPSQVTLCKESAPPC